MNVKKEKKSHLRTATINNPVDFKNKNFTMDNHKKRKRKKYCNRCEAIRDELLEVQHLVKVTRVNEAKRERK